MKIGGQQPICKYSRQTIFHLLNQKMSFSWRLWRGKSIAIFKSSCMLKGFSKCIIFSGKEGREPPCHVNWEQGRGLILISFWQPGLICTYCLDVAWNLIFSYSNIANSKNKISTTFYSIVYIIYSLFFSTGLKVDYKK